MTPLWAGGAAGAGALAVMQGDGNMVVYGGGAAHWSSGTSGHSGAYAVLQNDSNFVVYQGSSPLWSSVGGPVSGGGGGGGVDGSDGYPYKNAVDCTGTFGVYSWCINGNWASPYGYAYRNCTDFAAWWLEAHGVADGRVRGLGNAATWAGRAAAHGDSADHHPTPGSIAQWGSEVGGGFGHVAVVTSVNSDGTANVAEYNHFGNGTYDTRSHIAADYYVHF
jgi:hypothetical protein